MKKSNNITDNRRCKFSIPIGIIIVCLGLITGYSLCYRPDISIKLMIVLLIVILSNAGYVGYKERTRQEKLVQGKKK